MDQATLAGFAIAAVIPWIGACICYALARRGQRWSTVLAWVLGVLGSVFCFVSPSCLLQFIALFACGMACLDVGRGQSTVRFALLAILLSVVPYFVVYLYAQTVWGNVARQFPLVSLADRLAYETAPARRSAGMKHLWRAVRRDWRWGSVRPAPRRARHANRQLASRPLHVVARQIAQDGARYPGRKVRERRERIRCPPSARAQARRRRWPAGPPVPLPAGPSTTGDEPLPLPAALDELAAASAGRYHREAVMLFANVPGWGYVLDRDRVSGFQSHQFDKLPEEPGRPDWQIKRLELVSLLKHDQPSVYISEYLPAMDELREAPVRPLTDFERRGLASLLRGEEIHAEVIAGDVRMVGAIRAAEKCLDCHSVEHGACWECFRTRSCRSIMLPNRRGMGCGSAVYRRAVRGLRVRLVPPARPAAADGPEDSATKAPGWRRTRPATLPRNRPPGRKGWPGSERRQPAPESRPPRAPRIPPASGRARAASRVPAPRPPTPRRCT